MEPCDTENNTWEFKLCPMFKHSPNRKSMVYGPNGIYPQQKGIMVPIEYALMVYSPNRKGMVLWKIVFRSDNGHGQR